MRTEMVEAQIRTEMTRVSTLIGALMEHYTGENPVEVPGADEDHFSMFGYAEDTFTKIIRWVDKPDMEVDVGDLLNCCIELKTYCRILDHQAGLTYFDRPAAIGLAAHLVEGLIKTFDETFS